jgi:hypothetical protein
MKTLLQAPSGPIFCLLGTGGFTKSRTDKTISLKGLDKDDSLFPICMDEANPEIHGVCRWE